MLPNNLSANSPISSQNARPARSADEPKSIRGAVGFPPVPADGVSTMITQKTFEIPLIYNASPKWRTSTALKEQRKADFLRGTQETIRQTVQYYKTTAQRQVEKEEFEFKRDSKAGKMTRTELLEKRRQEALNQSHKSPPELPKFTGLDQPFYNVLTMTAPPGSTATTRNSRRMAIAAKHRKKLDFTDEEEPSRDDPHKVNWRTKTVSNKVGNKIPRFDQVDGPLQSAKIPYPFPLRPGRKHSAKPRFTTTIDRTDSEVGFIDAMVRDASNEEIIGPMYSSFTPDNIFREPQLPKPKRDVPPINKEASEAEAMIRPVEAIAPEALGQRMQAVVLGRSIAPRGSRIMRFDLQALKSGRVGENPRVSDAGVRPGQLKRPVSCPPGSVRMGGFDRMSHLSVR
ncbi:hypothetical protein J8273_6417 [Carpediemonas membranifera]|uniref:Uncharacterized protein n=1 Tax=Carpediemonas membranifera TaxID=201153 RepID=A0A8J6B2L6_9EUKA|nr:hypothetical protein J8273_6417 [Carpediemonas membranifera]|eukprot:KAG9391652.1 hypothetical protein J8273_6417 [Carpediemonas membranifera]